MNNTFIFYAQLIRISVYFTIIFSRYDARVKAMEVDERPTEKYSDIGGLDQQIQEVNQIVLIIYHVAVDEQHLFNVY